MKAAWFGRVLAAALMVTALGGAGIQSARAGGLVDLALEQPAAPGEIFVSDSGGTFTAVFSGATDEGETVTVATNASSPAAVLCQAVAGTDDRWSCTATAMPDFYGDVVVSDSVDTLTETFGAVNPPTFAAEFASGVTTEEPEVALRGKSVALALVEVYRDGSLACTTSANGDGKWICAITLTDADAGTNSLTAVQTPLYAGAPSAPTLPVALEYEPALVVVPVVPIDPVTPDPPKPPGPPGPSDPPGDPGPPAADPPIVAGPPAPSLLPPPLQPSPDAPIGEAPARVEAAAVEPAALGASSPADPTASAVPPARAGAPAASARLSAPLPGVARPENSGGAPGFAATAPTGPGVVQDADGWQTPTAFGSSLRPVGAVPFGNPAFTTSIALVVLGFFLLVALPAELLQSTIRENYDRIAPRIAPLQRAIGAARRRVPALGWFGQMLLLLITAVVTAFADPAIGFDPRSLRLVLALALVLFLVNYIGILANHLHAGTVYGARTAIAVRPAALLLVIASVAVSRTADIQPGLLFGLVLGLEVGSRLRQAHQARIAVSVSLVLLALGVASWLSYSALSPQWLANPTFANQLAGEVLTGVTVETVTTLVIALLPLTFLDGHTVFAASKAAWTGLYLVALAAFTIVILPLPSAWVHVPSLLSPWAIGFAAFGALSVGVWAYFRRFSRVSRLSR
jgi:hypothetical protein